MNKNNFSNIKEVKERLQGLLTRKMKAILFSVAASVVIGVIFGLISLQMAEKDGSSVAAINTTEKSDEQSGEDTAFDGISVYVVQAGIFKKNENADQWAKQFSKEGFSTIKWEREDGVYLLSGVGDSDETATRQAEQMKKANLDVFVKEWDVQTSALNVTAADEAYLTAFLKAWQKSLKEQDTSEMSAFAEHHTETSEAIQPFVDEVETWIEDEKKEEQLVLLHTMKAYENLFQ